MPVTAIKSQKDLLTKDILPKIHKEIRLEMKNFLVRKDFLPTHADTLVDTPKIKPEDYQIFLELSVEDRQRFNILLALKKDIFLIQCDILKDNSPDTELTEKYHTKLKETINKVLLNPKITKQYTWPEKLAIYLLNLISGLLVVPALVKGFVFTDTFFYSTQGKSKEAVDKIDEIVDSLVVTPKF